MRTVSTPAPVVEANVDWLTMTRRQPNVPRSLHDLAAELLYTEKLAGHNIQPWRGLGYSGFRAGGVLWGERPDTVLLQLSGQAAASAWMESLPYATGVSRLDLQTTIQLPDDRFHLARAAWTSFRRARSRDRERYANRKELSARLLDTSNSGSTFYLGSPKSDVRARLYDKSAEAPDDRPPGQWRYEVQYRNRPAALRARWLATRPQPRDGIVSAVWSHFSRRHVAPAFAPAVLEDDMPTPPRGRTDAERKREWLRTQVRPSLESLKDYYTRQELLEVLDLTDSWEPRWPLGAITRGDTEPTSHNDA